MKNNGKGDGKFYVTVFFDPETQGVGFRQDGDFKNLAFLQKVLEAAAEVCKFKHNIQMMAAEQQAQVQEMMKLQAGMSQGEQIRKLLEGK